MARFKPGPPSQLQARFAAKQALQQEEDDHDAQTAARLGQELNRSLQTRRTSPDRVPASSIVEELKSPFYPKHEDADSQRVLRALARIAGMAWTISRIERSSAPDAAEMARGPRAGVGMLAPDLQEGFEAMLARARTMYPEDRRVIVSTDVVRLGDHWTVTAGTMEGPA